MKGRLVQLNVSPGGMPKLAVPEAMVSEEGVAGDWQLNRKYHGGPKRAVCLYSVELLAGLSADTGVELLPGQIGENFTTTGIDLQHLHSGPQPQPLGSEPDAIAQRPQRLAGPGGDAGGGAGGRCDHAQGDAGGCEQLRLASICRLMPPVSIEG
jgi:hypothetical protein